MNWSRLTIDDLKLSLAQDEIDKLNTLSLSEDKINAVVQEQLDMAADAFRGAFIAKGYTIDTNEHYIPRSYKQFVLDYARWSIWTRFPMADDYALSEPRKEQYEYARDLLENPYIGVDPLDSDSEDEDPDEKYRNDAAITIPYQKFPSFPYSNGFWFPYTVQYDSLFGKSK